MLQLTPFCASASLNVCRVTGTSAGPRIRQLALDALLRGVAAAHRGILRLGTRLRHAQHESLAVRAGHLGIVRMGRLHCGRIAAECAPRMALRRRRRSWTHHARIHLCSREVCRKNEGSFPFATSARRALLGAQAGNGNGRIGSLHFQHVSHGAVAGDFIDPRLHFFAARLRSAGAGAATNFASLTSQAICRDWSRGMLCALALARARTGSLGMSLEPCW